MCLNLFITQECTHSCVKMFYLDVIVNADVKFGAFKQACEMIEKLSAHHSPYGVML